MNQLSAATHSDSQTDDNVKSSFSYSNCLKTAFTSHTSLTINKQVFYRCQRYGADAVLREGVDSCTDSATLQATLN